jgi:hypothetical protein
MLKSLLFFSLLLFAGPPGCLRTVPPRNPIEGKELFPMDSVANARLMKQRFEGQPLRKFLDEINAKAEEIVFTDEPPGWLRSVLIAKRWRDKDIVVEIYLDYTTPPFSATRDWDMQSIRSRKIKLLEWCE